MACIMYMLFYQQRLWVPPTDFMYAESDMFIDEGSSARLSSAHPLKFTPQFFEETKSWWFSYGKIMYHATLIFSAVDVAPRTSLEIGGLVWIILISAMVNAILYGNFASLTYEVAKDEILFQENYDDALESMTSLNIGLPEQQMVVDFLITNKKGTQDQDLFK